MFVISLGEPSFQPYRVLVERIDLQGQEADAETIAVDRGGADTPLEAVGLLHTALFEFAEQGFVLQKQARCDWRAERVDAAGQPVLLSLFILDRSPAGM